MTIKEALEEAQKIVVSGASWDLGAYTKSRCHFHNHLDKAGQIRLYKWVNKEIETGKRHKSQLPSKFTS